MAEVAPALSARPANPLAAGVSNRGLTGAEHDQICLGLLPVNRIERVQFQLLIPQLDVGLLHLARLKLRVGAHVQCGVMLFGEVLIDPVLCEGPVL